MLINGGSGEGSIIIKGLNKGDVSGTAPLGHASTVALNSVTETSTGDVTMIYITKDDCVVVGNVITGGRKGIAVTGGNNCTITGNNITDSTSVTGSGSGIRIQNGDNTLIVGNTIKNWANYGIHLRPTSGTPADYTIIGNRIDDITGSPGNGVWIENSVATSGIVIKNNHIRDTAGNGVAFDNSATNVSLSEVSDNHFTSPTVAISSTVSGSVIKRGNVVDGSQVTTITGATPAKPATDVAKTNNGGATTMTGITSGVAGDVLTVIIGDANTTIDFTGTTLKGNGGVDWTPTTGDHMTCTYDGTNWYCVVSDNTA